MSRGVFSPDTREFTVCIHCQKKLCKTCNVNLAPISGVGKNGNVYYRPECKTCENTRVGRVDTRNYRKKKPWNTLSLKIRQEVGKCESCGFVPEHLGQLDVDHVNGDPKDHSRENLMVLCANCHRLKSIRAQDWVKTMNRRYTEATGLRRPTPTEYMRLRRAKKVLTILDTTPYTELSRKDRMRVDKAKVTVETTTEALKINI